MTPNPVVPRSATVTHPGDNAAAVTAAATALLAAEPITANAWFTALRRGTMSRGEFISSQRQFYCAVGFFPRALAALTARLPSSQDRAVLVHNISEEHGFDEEEPALGFRSHLAHDRTFLTFLDSLGVSAADMQAETPRPPVQAFNLGLLGACSMEPAGFAMGALGLIEYAFAGISALIGQEVVAAGWVPAARLVHYSLHAEVDKRHAAEMFAAAARTGAPVSTICEGLAFGHFLFNRLYVDLLRP